MKFAGGVGFANVDLLYSGLSRIPEKGEEVYAKGFDMQLGGGVPAVMVSLTRLGVPSRLATFIGKDFFSDFVRKSFEKYQIDIVNLYEGEGMPVNLSSVMILREDRSFVSYRDAIEISPRMTERVYKNLKGAYVVEMCTGFLEAYRKLKEEGTILVFDTGWEDDLSIAKYEEYLKTADYYLPNRKEALKITGAKNVEDAAKCLGRYFSDVIIKLDKDGCLLRNTEGIKIIPPLGHVVPVDTTGAGDAFSGGFLYGLYNGYPVEQCIRFGNVAGGKCVQGRGCLTRFAEEKDLLRLAGKM